ncbi:hypothetical protein CEW88_11655 [Alloyangia pacifica]|uniref:Uncharacterized protein n=1 Tax=Alloyangia pacifica TaxID=311180 RepID=A0A2U8HER5_9RHOB|nr:hypothetical protein [Alloyangia pacifica]AWI84283.1 hypothetical protein CEW88_11655 [Alloyangia pacifica]
MSEATARATISRGTAGRLMAELRHTPELTPDRLKQLINPRFFPRNQKALKRSAERVRRHPGAVRVAVTSAPGLVVVARRHFVTTGSSYHEPGVVRTMPAALYEHVTFAPSSADLRMLDLHIQKHAIARWVERGGSPDPRDLGVSLADLDAAALHILSADLRGYLFGPLVGDSSGHYAAFGVPDARAGTWVVVPGLPEGTSQIDQRERDLIAVTYLGESELSEERQTYREHMLAHGIRATVQRWPDLFSPEAQDRH